jgi:hypothetical protein
MPFACGEFQVFHFGVIVKLVFFNHVCEPWIITQQIIKL